MTPQVEKSAAEADARYGAEVAAILADVKRLVSDTIDAAEKIMSKDAKIDTLAKLYRIARELGAEI